MVSPQVICEIDNAAGEAAVQRLRLLLAIDAPCVQSVVDMITGYAHFGLRPEQLIVMRWVGGTRASGRQQ
jgi:hypothetical protein